MVVKIEVYFDGEFWCARGIGHDIFTCAKNLDELMVNVKEATACHFEEELNKGKPLTILTLTETEVAGVTQTATG